MAIAAIAYLGACGSKDDGGSSENGGAGGSDAGVGLSGSGGDGGAGGAAPPAGTYVGSCASSGEQDSPCVDDYCAGDQCPTYIAQIESYCTTSFSQDKCTPSTGGVCTVVTVIGPTTFTAVNFYSGTDVASNQAACLNFGGSFRP